MLTQGRLREFLDYDPKIGVFTWRKDIGPCVSGAVAGCPDKNGYIIIGFDKKRYKAHRLAWLYVYGEFPSSHIDHINRIKNDNRICNLRVADDAQNRQNCSRQRNNTSGLVGVHYQKSSGKWISYIKLHGNQIYLGIYPSIEEAKAARSAAKAKLHTFNPEDPA